jgi:hypothetical protein
MGHSKMASNDTNDERKRKLDRFRAAKSKLVSAKEYDNPSSKVLVFNSSKSIPDFQGKFGSVVQYSVYDPDMGMERIVNASALSYVNAVEEILTQKPSGTDVKIRVKKTGSGSDTRYTGEFVN